MFRLHAAKVSVVSLLIFAAGSQAQIRPRESDLMDSLTTRVGSVASLCSLVLPAGLTSAGLPVGIEFAALPGADRALLSLGAAIERVLGALPPPDCR